MNLAEMQYGLFDTAAGLGRFPGRGWKLIQIVAEVAPLFPEIDSAIGIGRVVGGELLRMAEAESPDSLRLRVFASNRAEPSPAAEHLDQSAPVLWVGREAADQLLPNFCGRPATC